MANKKTTYFVGYCVTNAKGKATFGYGNMAIESTTGKPTFKNLQQLEAKIAKDEGAMAATILSLTEIGNSDG